MPAIMFRAWTLKGFPCSQNRLQGREFQVEEIEKL
jgi:hypothetical protein